MNTTSNIIYTLTDESPLLSTYSFLAIICAFVKNTNIRIEICDISLSFRIISAFSEYLYFEQRRVDDVIVFKNNNKKKKR